MKIKVLDRIETEGYSKENIDSLVKEARSIWFHIILINSSSTNSPFHRDVMSNAFCDMAKEGKAE